MKLCLILTIYLYIFPQELIADVCSFNSEIEDIPRAWWYSTADKVRQCFRSIPADPEMMNSTLIQLFNSLYFYSFLDIVRQSNAPYYTNVDLFKELQNISIQANAKLYTNDYDFHMAIVSAFNKLNDFHTRYSAPAGYAKFDLLLPFIFEYIPTTQQVKIKLGIKLYSLVTENNANLNYNDKIVTKIDGINALEYMRQFAQTQSLISKDIVVKLNSAFREEFWLRNLANYPLPTTNNISITILDTSEVTVTFPYAVIITSQIQDTDTMQFQNAFVALSDVDISEVRTLITTDQALDWYLLKNNSYFQYVADYDSISYYTDNFTQTAVIKLRTFAELSANAITTVFSMVTGKTLIIDLIGNHGGASCLAYSLLKFLVPEYANWSAVYQPIDARITKPLQSFSQSLMFYSNSIMNLQTGLPFNNMEWIDNTVNYTRGGTTNAYSIKWSINCEASEFGSVAFSFNSADSKKKYFENIYVLTDGTCGGACSLFLSTLKYASNFKKVFGIGGGYNGTELFESSSYAGGIAYTWNSIVESFLKNNGSTPTLEFLSTSAALSVNVYEIYIKQLSSNYPREFLKQPIDIQLNNSDYINIKHALLAIINYNNPGREHPTISNCFEKMSAPRLFVAAVFLLLIFFIH